MHSSVKTTRRKNQESDYNRALARALVERNHLTLQQAKSALIQLKDSENKKSFEDFLFR